MIEETITQGASLAGNIGIPTVLAWFMFRQEKILTKLTDTIMGCKYRLK